jgi:hypothetical protein
MDTSLMQFVLIRQEIALRHLEIKEGPCVQH